jgi:hypothetical protein
VKVVKSGALEGSAGKNKETFLSMKERSQSPVGTKDGCCIAINPLAFSMFSERSLNRRTTHGQFLAFRE